MTATASKHSVSQQQYRAATKTRHRFCVSLAIMLLLASSAARAATTGYDDIAPILSANCIVCHSGQAAAAGLQLDSYDSILEGSSRSAVVKAGDAENSELIRRVRGTSQPRMPMTGPPFLTDGEVASLERWIDGGLQPAAPGAAASAVQQGPLRPAAGEPVTYRHVAPIFARRCAKCHTDNGAMGRPPEGYRLTSHAATVAAGDRVRVIPGNAAASELVRRIRGQSRPRMPFDGPPYLDEEEIRLIEDWITQGARDSEGEKAPIPVGARVRLHGRLEAGNRLDGVQLIIGRGTRIDKNPRPGDYVQVRGRVDQAGSIQVERLRRR